MSTTLAPETIPEFAPATEALRAELAEIEEKVVTGFTLADAMREGSSVTDQARNTYGYGHQACAMSAAAISAKARGYL